MIFSATRPIRKLLFTAVLFIACTHSLQAADYFMILSGSGGSPEYQSKFRSWTQRLKTSIEKLSLRSSPEIIILAEAVEGKDNPGAPISKDAVLDTFKDISSRIVKEDTLYLFLIGHGSHLRETTKFQVPGEDLTADDFESALTAISASNIVFVNSGSVSAGFINVLSAPGRVICSATKSVREVNAPEYMEYFLQGLEDGSADQNRDDRISFLEAARQADALTQAFYVAEGLLASEHALLDDNGDGLGTKLSETRGHDAQIEGGTTNVVDGSLADTIFMKDFSFPEFVPKEYIERYLGLLDQIDELKTEKTDLDEANYKSTLEKLLIEAARAHREIRSYSPDVKSDS